MQPRQAPEVQNASEDEEGGPYLVVEKLKAISGAGSLADLAASLGVAVSNVKGWNRRRSVPLSVLVQCVNRWPDTSLDWLMGLKSDPSGTFHVQGDLLVKRNDEQGTLPIVVNSPLRSRPDRRSAGEDLDRAPVLHYREGGLDFDFVLVPRYDVTASAGPGTHVVGETQVGEIAFERRWMRRHLGRAGSDFALVDVSGQSMEPTLFDGATIVVDLRQKSTEGGGIFVLRREADLFVKRVQRRVNGDLQVISDNPAFQQDIVPAGSELQLEVIGRVVWPRSR